MIPALAVAIGLIWLFGSEAMKKPDKPTDPETPERPNDPITPDLPPSPPVDGDVDGDGIVEFEDLTVWSGEGSVDQSVVWSYQMGIRKEDGSEEYGNPYIVIGDSAHHNFLRSNSNRGTIDIPKERTGGSSDQRNVIVFASVQDALDRLNEEEEPRDPTDPVQPQPQPEDDDEDPNDRPSQPFPPRPDYGLGGGGLRLFTNGGV